MIINENFLGLIAFSPIFLAGILLVGFRVPARIAMPAVFIFTCFIAYFLWGMTSRRILASALQGLIICGSIL